MNLKIENDFKELDRKYKIALGIVLGLAVLCVISWAADGFASLSNELLQRHLSGIDHLQGYNSRVSKSWS